LGLGGGLGFGVGLGFDLDAELTISGSSSSSDRREITVLLLLLLILLLLPSLLKSTPDTVDMNEGDREHISQDTVDEGLVKVHRQFQVILLVRTETMVSCALRCVYYCVFT